MSVPTADIFAWVTIDEPWFGYAPFCWSPHGKIICMQHDTSDELAYPKPRPTLKFLKLLPEESLAQQRDYKLFKAGAADKITVGAISHPLIDNAAREFQTGLPDKHVSSSKSAGRPVYEVRSRTGAAWRAAVIVDEKGFPWLIYAAKHDKFHALASSQLSASQIESWLPTALDRKLLLREEAEVAHQVWQRAAILAILGGLSQAISLPANGEVSVSVPGFTPRDKQAEVRMAMEHDPPGPFQERSQSLATLSLRITEPTEERLHRELIRSVLPLLQPDTQKHHPDFHVGGEFEVLIELTQAKITQLVALQLQDAHESHLEITCEPNTLLHYVSKFVLVEAMITGSATRAVCGTWFVPTKDKEAELPICPSCEEKQPYADLANQIIRRTQI